MSSTYLTQLTLCVKYPNGTQIRSFPGLSGRRILPRMKTVAQNRRARYDYEIQDTLEAGIVLTGAEVKSVRGGHVQLQGAYVSFLGGRPVLKNASIAKYAFATDDGYEPKRDRLLLLKKSELGRLQAASAEKGIAIIPLDMRAGRYAKLTLGIGRGRKRVDKRQRIKEREIGRKLREGGDV